MQEVEIGGVVYLTTAEMMIVRVEWLQYQGRAWLAPSWAVSPDGTVMSPVRIIAPVLVAGSRPMPGPEALEFLEAGPLPARLLEHGEIPPELLRLVEVRESPEIFAIGPAAMN